MSSFDINSKDYKFGNSVRDNLLQAQIEGQTANSFSIVQTGDVVEISLVAKDGTILNTQSFKTSIGNRYITDAILDNLNQCIILYFSDGQALTCDLQYLYQTFNLADQELRTAINVEQARAEQAEANLSRDLEAETNRAQRAEDQLTSDLSYESSRAQQAESQLSSDLATEIRRAEQAESNEYNRATSAEEALENRLTNELNYEASVRADKDTLIDSNVSNLRTDFENNVSAIHQDLNNETYNREQADLTLTSYLEANISSLRSETQNNASELRTAINDEITRAQNNESAINTSINSRIDNEISTLNQSITNNVSALQSSISNEASTRRDEDSALDQRITQEVNTLTNSVSNVANDLANESTRAQREEGYLSSNLSNEIYRAQNIEANLSLGLSSEAERAQLAEFNLSRDISNVTNNLSNEINRATRQEGYLSANLSAEILRAEQAESQLGSDLGNESTARSNADLAINSSLANEVQARKDAINTSNQNLSNEVNRSTAAESAINTSISNLSLDLGNESQDRINADLAINTSISAIESKSDVVDIVGTYADLEAYDTTGLGDNDVIKVLQDETQNDQITYYRYNKTTDNFTLIGAIGPFYTQGQTDTLIAQVNSDLNNESARAEGVESNLSLDISNLSTYLTSNVSALSNDITNEANRATLAESAINTSKQNNLISGNGINLSNDILSVKYDNSTIVLDNNNLSVGSISHSKVNTDDNHSFVNAASVVNYSETAVGDATHIPVIKTNKFGQVTEISNIAINASSDNQRIKTSSVTFGDNDLIEIKQGNNITITGDSINKSITISSSYVDTDTTYTFNEGSVNGAFQVTPSDGNAQTVNIHGLGNAAYATIGTGSTDVARGSHGHNLSLASTSNTSTVDLSANAKYSLKVAGSEVVFKTPVDNNTNYYHTPEYSAGLKIATGTGVNDLYVPTGTSGTSVCAGDDSRLSDARTPKSHSHGNITNDGKITAAAVTTGAGIVVVDSGGNINRMTNASSARSLIGAGTSNLTLGTSGTTAAYGNHTHDTTLVSGGTSTIDLAANTTYTLTAGGKSVIFKTPTDSNTNYYHTTGSWNGLTYTASKVGSPGDLAFTIPTGTNSATVSRGDHTHSYIPKTLTSTKGDIIYASAANTPARLGIGSTNQVLTVSNGIPAWTTTVANASYATTAGSTNAVAGYIVNISNSMPSTLSSNTIYFIY